jgi:DNA polymerase-3 subunit gamma/tau
MSGLDLGTLGLNQVDDEGNPAAAAAPTAPAAPAAPTPVAPVIPVAEPAPVVPVAPAPEPEPEPIVVPEGAKNPDAVQRAMAAERAKAREAYAEAKRLERELTAIREANMPAEERLRLAESRAQAAESNLLKFKVGLRHKLPEEVTDLLRGTTEEELDTHAQSLLPMLNLGPAPAPAPEPTPTPGAAPNVPVPTAGGYQQQPPAAKPDPAKAHGMLLGQLLTGQLQQ